MQKLQIFRAYGDSLERLDIEANSMDEATVLTGHGIYTVLRTYPGNMVARLDYHWARLRLSARIIGLQYDLSDDWLRYMLQHAVAESECDPARVRLTIPFDAPDSATISVEPFHALPDTAYTDGVAVALVEGQRESPLAKNSQFIEWRQSAWQNVPDGTHEIVMVDPEGMIREGTNSNFFAVIDGVLRTASEGMLEGIARGILLDVAPEVLPVELEAIHISELEQASEAMLTSASRRVLPVVQVGEYTIDGGVPGPIAAELLAMFDAQVQEELTEL
jgi:branched-chain amino acid aminotransferase